MNAKNSETAVLAETIMDLVDHIMGKMDESGTFQVYCEASRGDTQIKVDIDRNRYSDCCTATEDGE